MARWITRAPFDGAPKHPSGRKRCRWCGTEVPKGRRTWCSQECVDEYLVRKSSADARRLVFRRDRGVCAECGLDCDKLRKELSRLRYGEGVKGNSGSYIAARTRKLELAEMGFDYWRKTLWDCDHVVPVSEGGGTCGLENLRTLCQPCHRKATAALAGRRSRK